MNKSMNTVIWVVAIAAVLVAAYTFYEKNKTVVINPPVQQSTQQTTRESTPQNSTQPEKIMAPDFALKDLEGNSVKLSDYKGKIVILNFWAVWCKYCKLEMPELNELNKELEEGDDAVLLAIDVQEPLKTVSDYLTSNNINIRVLMDTEGTVAQTYGITGYPTTFIINPDGSLYTYITGATTKKALLEIIDKINQQTS